MYLPVQIDNPICRYPWQINYLFVLYLQAIDVHAEESPDAADVAPRGLEPESLLRILADLGGSSRNLKGLARECVAHLQARLAVANVAHLDGFFLKLTTCFYLLGQSDVEQDLSFFKVKMGLVRSQLGPLLFISTQPKASPCVPIGRNGYGRQTSWTEELAVVGIFTITCGSMFRVIIGRVRESSLILRLNQIT